MSFVYLTQSSPGAPPLIKANGSLCALLDWALPQAGWTILHSTGFARVYRSQNGRMFHIDHDSASSGAVHRAVVRGCTGASGAKTITGAFPTAAQAANNLSCWRIGINATTSATSPFPFEFIADSNHFVLVIERIDSGTRDAEVWFFGETMSDFPQDTNCLINISRSTSLTTTSQQGLAGLTAFANSGSGVAGGDLFWQGSVDGSVPSSQARLYGPGFGITGAPAARAGYENRIFREPVSVADYGGSGIAITPMFLARRGFLPNIWTMLHGSMGQVSFGDTFLDAQYDPAAVFKASELLIYEITDTWRPR